MHKLVVLLLCYLMVLLLESKAMSQEEMDEHHNRSLVRVSVNSSEFTGLPQELQKEVVYTLSKNDVLHIRATSKALRNLVDEDYWQLHSISIQAKSSSPALEEVNNIPFLTALLSFENWEQKDIQSLLSLKQVTKLRLAGLEGWDFSTGEVFNPSLLSSCAACIHSILPTTFLKLFKGEVSISPIFANLISLDLSNSKIGDYGVTSFVAHFKKLKTLNLSNNKIGKNIIGEVNALAKLHTLTSLNISKNYFSSGTIEKITCLTKLTSLDISYNFVSDKRTIEELKQLPQLSHFIHNLQRQESALSPPLPIP